MNFAGVVARRPCVLVCQNNHWSISVPTAKQTASRTIAVKARAYGIPGVRVDGNDVLAVYTRPREARRRARARGERADVHRGAHLPHRRALDERRSRRATARRPRSTRGRRRIPLDRLRAAPRAPRRSSTTRATPRSRRSSPPRSPRPSTRSRSCRRPRASRSSTTSTPSCPGTCASSATSSKRAAAACARLSRTLELASAQSTRSSDPSMAHHGEDLRRDRDRRRPRRLRLRHPPRAAQAEGPLRREGRGRRRVPQLGLRPVARRSSPTSHTFEKVKDGRRRSASWSTTSRIDVEQDAGLEGRHRQEAHRRRARLFKGNGVELAHRRRARHRPAARSR